MAQIFKKIHDALSRNVWFYIFSAFALALIVASWMVPPMGVIDGSVLAAVGEIFAFAALGALLKAMDNGIDAKVSHGDTSLLIGNLDEQPKAPNHDSDC